MPLSSERLSYQIATLPTFHLVVAGILCIGVTKAGWTGFGVGALAVWTYAVAVELHRVLPPTFFEGRRVFEVHLLRELAFGAVIVASTALFRLAGAVAGEVGSETVRHLGLALVPVAFLLFVGAVVSTYYVVRHVLSAVASAESGRPERASVGCVLVHMLLTPVYVIRTHMRARHVILQAGA